MAWAGLRSYQEARQTAHPWLPMWHCSCLIRSVAGRAGHVVPRLAGAVSYDAESERPMQRQLLDGSDDQGLELAALHQRISALEAELAAWREQAQARTGWTTPLPAVDPFLAAVLAQLPVGVAIAEAPSGQLLMHNAEAVQLLRHPLLESADYTGYARYGALHPDGRPYQPQEYPIARALLGQDVIRHEDMIYRRGDGTLTTFAVNAAPIHDHRGQLIAVVSTFHDIAHQRELEAALRESEARFAAAFHVSPVAMVVSTAAEGRILDANMRFLTLFGREREAIIGQPSPAIEMWIDPADRARAMELLQRDGHVHDWEVVIQGAGGTPRHVLLSVELLQLADTLCLLTALYDITDRVCAEAALRESEERFRLFIAHTPAAVAMLDRELRYLAVSRRWMENYDLQDEIIGRSHYEVFPELPERWKAIHQRSLAGAVERSNEDSFVRADGFVDWLKWEVRPWYDSAGAIGGIIIFSEDITAHKRAAAAIQQSEALYHAIAHSLPDAAVFVVDHDVRYLLAEGPGVALLGLSQDELVGSTPQEVLDMATAPQAMAHFRQALAGEEVILEQTYVERIWWTHYTPLRDDDGQIWAAMALVLDVTARKRLEEQLLQAQKMESIGQLAGGIAHDFNNLLTAISGYAELALGDLPSNAPTRSDLAEIQKATDRAAALTRQLLAFSRRQRLETRILNLNDLVSDLEQLLRRLIGEHIQLVTAPAPDLGLVLVDPGQIERVLVNLAVNARDAMPEGGTLTITTANVELDPHSVHGHVDLPAGPYVLLVVSDTGTGIPPELRPHLFEPFFTTKPPGAGSGLGLATCYGIVTQHGGAIWLYSEVGHGTVVKIYLPRDGATTASPRQPAPAAVLPEGHETVLLAEDEPAVRAMAVRVLRACGYTVLEAANGAEALQVAAAHAPQPIHLLLSDVVMPHMGGPAAAEQLRAWHPTLRVLYMSGYTGMAGAWQTIAARDEPLIQKPFSPSDLAVAVRAALDR